MKTIKVLHLGCIIITVPTYFAAKEWHGLLHASRYEYLNWVSITRENIMILRVMWRDRE